MGRKGSSKGIRTAARNASEKSKEEFKMKKSRILIIGILLCGALFSGCAQKGNVQEETLADAAAPTAENEAGTTEDNGEAEAEKEPEDSSEDIKSQANEKESKAASLPDGVYTAEFKTDSSMFHVSEACDGKGTLTVENGEMTLHISLGSKKILNLYPGTAQEAAKEGAELLMPTEDTVTYSDGLTEEVYGFDVPVPVLEEEFDLALIGTKGKWYDHKVSVSGAELLVEDKSAEQTKDLAGKGQKNADAGSLEDGSYTVELTFEGGSGKATVLSPAALCVKEGAMSATLTWSSPNYDYMIVGGEKYLPVNTEGNSVFEVPVLEFDKPIDVVGDTVAMSKPHEVEYTITFHLDTVKPVE